MDRGRATVAYTQTFKAIDGVVAQAIDYSTSSMTRLADGSQRRTSTLANRGGSSMLDTTVER
jgi:hypothetical protein